MSEKLELTEDNRELIERETKNLINAVATLKEYIQKGSLTIEFKGTLLSVIESYTLDIFNALDYGKNLQEEKNKRHEEIKKANQKIHELEKQIKNFATNSFDISMIADVVNSLNDKLKNKWDNKENGLDGLVKLNIEGYHATIEFIPMFTCHAHNYPDPVTKRKEHEDFMTSLKEKGYEFAEGKDELILNEKNVNLCIDFIKSFLPYFKVKEIKNVNWENRFRIKAIIGTISVKELIHALR